MLNARPQLKSGPNAASRRPKTGAHAANDAGGAIAWSRALAVVLALACAGLGAFAQAAGDAAPAAAGMSLVRWAGSLPDAAGRLVEIRFAIFQDQAGGLPLWTETQPVKVSADGRYSVLLGANSAEGLPPALFQDGLPRWIEARLAARPGADAAPARSLLAAVPYAFKAVDAETLAGRPAADYLTREDLQSAVAGRMQAATAHPDTGNPVTGEGTTGYIPVWTGAATLGNSPVSVSGVNVGIGTPGPVYPLDVNGTEVVRGLLKLEGNVAATAKAGVNSPQLDFQAVAYSSSAKASQRQHMVWQALDTGNNTPSPGANLALLYAEGNAVPKPTGFSIGPTGLVTFAAGQTFPGAGTITGVTAGSGLTGGGTSGAVTLGVDTTQIPRLSAYNTFTTGATFDGETTITGNSGDYMLVVTNTSAASKATILGQAIGSEIGILGASPAGYGVKGASTSGTGVEGISTSGEAGYFSNQSATMPSVFVSNVGGTGLEASSTTGSAGTFTSQGAGSPTVVATNSAKGSIAMEGENANGLAGYFGNTSDTYAALAGEDLSTSTSAVGVYAYSPHGYGAYGTTTDGYGIYGTTTGFGFAVYGSSTDGMGAVGASVHNTGMEASSLDGDGLDGRALFHNAVTGTTGNQLGSGSLIGGTLAAPAAGVWGDVTGFTNYTPNPGAAVLGTADDLSAGYFLNNTKDAPTLSVTNASGGSTNTLFRTLSASGPGGVCGINGGGDLTCTGQVKTLAPAGGGKRMVETYAMQSPENWMEDFGSGELKNGAAVVTIDPAFGETVTADAGYHVFLTPNGDSKGLYVIRKTAAGFEVRESGGGTSNLSFDYRIVARRRGYEAQRLVDVTDRYNAEHVPAPGLHPDGRPHLSGKHLLQ